MKTLNRIVLIGALLAFTTNSFAQKPKTGCVDMNIQGQADGIKNGLTKQGHALFQEGMFQMTSMEPTPIALKLSQGITYQLIFVGSENSFKIIMELYDGKDHKIDEKIERGSNNSIIYSFTPAKTDIYLVTLIQKRATKDMCGYFGVMMKGGSALIAARPQQQPVEKPQSPAPAPVQKKAPAKIAAATPVKKTTVTPVAHPSTSKANDYPDMPANQRPNPNRTRATQEAQGGK